MKYVVATITAAFLASAHVGCQYSHPTATVGVETAETTPPPPAGVTLVKLKLPAMVCGGCAEEVKETLAKVDGVSHIAADPTKNECTFWFAKSEAEIKAKLDSLAKTSEKIEGYERLN